MKPAPLIHAAFILTAVATFGLSACGGSTSNSASGGSGGGSGGSYCDRVKAIGDFETRLSKVDPTNGAATVATVSKLTTEINSAKDAAPDEVKADWEKVSAVFTELTKAMTSLKDLDLSDPSKVSAEQLAALQALAPKMKSMQSDLASASDAIDQNALKECGFSLGES